MTRPAESIDSVLREFQGRAQWPTPLSVEGLVAQWAKFVELVESGYPFSVYDYDNDLGTRDLIGELLGRVDATARAELTSAVEPWDERFRFATEALKSALPSAPNEPAWWWFRRPRLLKGELKSDFEEEGLA